jgi:hypothetical protein
VPHFDELVGDKGFNVDDRLSCVSRDVFPSIPNRKSRKAPWLFMPEGCVEQNRVERLFGKLRQVRRIATRYDKLKETYLIVIY